MRLAVPRSASPKRPPTGPSNTGQRSSSRPLSPLFSTEALSAVVITSAVRTNKPTTSVSKVTAQLQLAELYQDSNQPLDARKMYEQIKKDNPATEAGQLATQRLAQLK